MTKFFLLASLIAALASAQNPPAALVNIVTNAGALETLENLITQANLLSAFEDATNWTVFAPRNIAFDELGDLTNDLSTPAWSAHLTSVLTTHVVEGVFDSGDIANVTSLTALSGETLQVTADPLTVDGANPTRANIIASNGIVHIMNAVLTPSWVDTNLPTAAASVSELSNLTSFLSQANLIEALSAEGPFTVFAPTNQAFENLDAVTSSCIMNSPELLSSVLLYHVVEDLVPAAEVATGDVETMESSDISIDAEALTINGDVNIVTTDAHLANNGIVHIIDSVLVPASVSDACAEAPTEPVPEPTGPTLASIVMNSNALNTLENLVGLADLLPAFEDATNWTVFAPRNIAFDTLGDLATDLSTPAWSAHLTSVLTTHVVEGVYDTAAIASVTSLMALSGETLEVTADPLAVEGVFPAQRTNIPASNGILHIMDGVITPAWVEMNLPMAVAPASDFSTLVSLLTQANLTDALAAEGPFTVFAPTNKAFEDLGEITTSCVTNSPEILSSVLQYHVVEALVPGAGVMTGDVVTLESSAISIDADALTINTGASIVTADALLANNGIVHAIDSVLVPDTVADEISSCVEVSTASPMASPAPVVVMASPSSMTSPTTMDSPVAAPPTADDTSSAVMVRVGMALVAAMGFTGW